MTPEPEQTEPLLHGHSPLRGVVAMEATGQFYRLFLRKGQDITFRDVHFSPFLLASQPDKCTALAPCTCQPLEGSGAYRYLLAYDTWQNCCLMRNYLAKADTSNPPLFIPDPAHQFLLTTGITFFRDLHPDQVPVTFLATETVHTPEGMVFRIAVSDGKQTEVLLSSDQMPEKMMFEQLTLMIRDQDPDLLIGYDLSRQLADLIQRARNAGARLPWGRNRAAIQLHEGRSSRENHCAVFGRSTLDLRHLILQVHHGQPVSDYRDPVETAVKIGCLDRDTDRSDPFCVTRALREIYRQLAPAFFQLAALVPFAPPSFILKDAPSLVSGMLLREYLRQHHAVPLPSTYPMANRPPEEADHNPALTRRHGPHGPVVHCEVRALIPSILLAYRLAPAGDDLELFLPMLHHLTRLKSQARQEAEAAASSDRFVAADGRRSLLAALARGFHGMLASQHSPFADHHRAAEADRLARVLINDLVNWLREQGAEPLELDRDGIYFVPPPGHDGTEEIARLLTRLSEILPGEMTLSCDAGYQAMFCYKPGNYALLGYDDELLVKGSSLRSHGLEPFLRDFLHGALRLLLQNAGNRVATLYEEQVRLLVSHQVPVEQLARTEKLSTSPEQYRHDLRDGKRNRNAALELALHCGVTLHAGDRISYYITGNAKNVTVHEHCRLLSDFDPQHPDINIPWYTERLYQLYRRLTPFVTDEPTLF